MDSSGQQCLLVVSTLFGLVLFATGCERFWGCEATATCHPAPAIIGVVTTGSGATGSEGSGGAAGTGGSGDGGMGGGEGGGSACADDPATGEMAEGCCVWASVVLGDDAHEGTQGQPVKTLARAIELAGTAGSGAGRVCACGGDSPGDEYPEWVVLPDGISLLGGFDCSDGWEYTGFDNRAVVRAPGAPATLTLTASEKESLITDFVIVANDAVEPGASAIAVMARPDSKARFRRVELAAGSGADGADGENGSHEGVPAPKGAAGNDGMDACVEASGLGGPAAATQCPDGAQSVGGQGGDGNAVAANDGQQGFEAPDPNPQSHGVGGKGQTAAAATQCTGGTSGAHGKDGVNGLGATGGGVLTTEGFVGSRGADGLPGLPGQGGGGGGASLGTGCGAAPPGGAGGGSGGAGGCGGRAGKGGQAGGSSIAVALLSNGLHVEDIVFRNGNGGKGGNGGARQSGGQGGLPGYGGLGFGGAPGAQGGCAGGAGGQGGDGGSGGGGRGGHTTSVVRTEGNVLKLAGRITYIRGEKGPGGKAGDPSSDLGAGKEGDKTDTVALEP